MWSLGDGIQEGDACGTGVVHRWCESLLPGKPTSSGVPAEQGAAVTGLVPVEDGSGGNVSTGTRDP